MVASILWIVGAGVFKQVEIAKEGKELEWFLAPSCEARVGVHQSDEAIVAGLGKCWHFHFDYVSDHEIDVVLLAPRPRAAGLARGLCRNARDALGACGVQLEVALYTPLRFKLSLGDRGEPWRGRWTWQRTARGSTWSGTLSPNARRLGCPQGQNRRAVDADRRRWGLHRGTVSDGARSREAKMRRGRQVWAFGRTVADEAGRCLLV